jgi:ribonuclease E
VKVGSTSRERRQGDQRRQRRGRALETEGLLVVLEAAGKQAQPNDPVADDHDRREDRVARQRRFVGPAGKHDREDQRQLDHRHGDREDEGAERLADAVGDHLGVVHRRENGADERRHGEGDEGHADRQHERGADQRHREQGKDSSPDGRARH